VGIVDGHPEMLVVYVVLGGSLHKGDQLRSLVNERLSANLAEG
jgi:hypothetical protein